MRVRQLSYISRADPSGKYADIEGILDRSRHNNARDAITGLLWTDTYRFLQVLEGEEEKVGDCFARIRRDPATAISSRCSIPSSRASVRQLVDGAPFGERARETWRRAHAGVAALRSTQRRRTFSSI